VHCIAWVDCRHINSTVSSMKNKKGYGSLLPSDEDVESGRRERAASTSGVSSSGIFVGISSSTGTVPSRGGGGGVIHPPVSRERGNSVSGTPKVGRSPHGGSAIATGAMRVSSPGGGGPSHQRVCSAQDATPLLRGLERPASQGGEKWSTGAYLAPITQNDDYCNVKRQSPRKKTEAAADEKKRGGMLPLWMKGVVFLVDDRFFGGDIFVHSSDGLCIFMFANTCLTSPCLAFCYHAFSCSCPLLSIITRTPFLYNLCSCEHCNFSSGSLWILLGDF
jgi:hypothetical protein